MRPLHRAVSGVLALLRRSRVERELDAELRDYLDAAIDDKMRAGLSRAEAARAARSEMGSLEAVKDQTRDAGWETRVEILWRDVRYAARTLSRSPAFSAVAILVLALGIGATTAIFSVVNAVLLRPLPVDRPDELIALSTVNGANADPLFSYAAYRQLAVEGAAVADACAAASVRREAIAVDGPPEPLNVKFVSGNYFTVLGVRAAVGRTLVAGDDRVPAGERVAVVSDAYWTRRFGRDPSVVGRAFRYKARPFTIVGVAPHGFFGETVGEAPDLWTPMTAQPDAPSFLWTGHSATWLQVLARRRPGLTLAHVRAGLDPVYARVRDDIAGETADPRFRQGVLHSRLGVSAAPGGASKLRDPFSRPLLILMAIVGLVLAIACANVANLMLARAAVRRRETAVSLAFGASRGRVARQLLLEAGLLAAAGGAAGLAIAVRGSAALVTLVAGAGKPISLDAGVDRRVLAFTIVVSSATAIVFGLVPALGASRLDPLAALKRSAGSGRAGERLRVRRLLVVCQIALSIVLLVGAALFVRSLGKLQNIEPGFDPTRVLVFELTPPVDERPVSREEANALYRRLLARAESVPGVQAASAAFTSLFTQGSWGNAITVEGFVPELGVTPRTFANAVTPRYFEVMGIAVVGGRPFAESDHESAPRVVIVNQTFARQFFGESLPIGKHVGLGAPAKQMMEVVGIVGDAKYVDLREAQRPMLYVPFTQYRQQSLRELEVRTTAAPTTVAATLRQELAAVDFRLAIVGTMELRDRVDASLAPERLVARLSAGFGLLALALAAIGLYGVVAYVTTQRTGEIGIRMALGADGASVRRLVLGDTLKLVAVGVAIGAPAALAAARLLASQLYSVTPHDPASVAAALAALVCSAGAAGYLPARRASRVDPLAALRCE